MSNKTPIDPRQLAHGHPIQRLSPENEQLRESVSQTVAALRQGLRADAQRTIDLPPPPSNQNPPPLTVNPKPESGDPKDPSQAFDVPRDLIPGKGQTLEDTVLQNLDAALAALDDIGNAQTSFPDPNLTGQCMRAFKQDSAVLQSQLSSIDQKLAGPLPAATRQTYQQERQQVLNTIAQATVRLRKCLEQVEKTS